MFFSSAECDYSICWRNVGGRRSQYHTHLHRDVLSHCVQSLVVGKYVVSKTAIFVCTLFRSKWPYRLLLFKLVMVYTSCHGRHSHCGSNDSAGTITLLGHFTHRLKPSFTAKKGKRQALQLRVNSDCTAYYRDKFTDWYLFLAGTLHRDVVSNFLFSKPGGHYRRTLCGLSCKLSRDRV